MHTQKQQQRAPPVAALKQDITVAATIAIWRYWTIFVDSKSSSKSFVFSPTTPDSVNSTPDSPIDQSTHHSESPGCMPHRGNETLFESHRSQYLHSPHQQLDRILGNARRHRRECHGSGIERGDRGLV